MPSLFSSCLIESNPCYVWYSRLDHPQAHSISKIIHDNSLSMTTTISSSSCLSCLQGKLAKIPLASIQHHAISTLEIVHVNVKGHLPTFLNVGFKYLFYFVFYYVY